MRARLINKLMAENVKLLDSLILVKRRSNLHSKLLPQKGNQTLCGN